MTTAKQMSVTIDGKVIKITPSDKNIVDVASRSKIAISSPCYHNQQSKGCCGTCVIDIDGEQKYACSTVPKNEMNIVVDRADLKAIRKERLLQYQQGINNGNSCGCNCSE
jgi:predicted molibdopterin-dependent oxidoreductase YjgC